MTTTMLNGSLNPENAASNTSMSSSGRQQTKAAFNNKNTDGNRKQPSNPNDLARRNPPQKAWTSGMNPITQRSTTPAQQNGVGSQSRNTSQKPIGNQETSTSDRHANDRLLYLFANSMGLPASITVKNGDVFSGIFFGSTIDNQESAYLLKMVQQVHDKGEVNGTKDCLNDYIGVGDDHAMSFDIKEVVNLAIEGVVFNARDKSQNGANIGIRTDADISGNLPVRQRSLKRWEPSTESDVDLSLEQPGGTWDQFQANEQKFGLISDYHENFYTTPIDKSNPLYHQREAEARRIAQEIEGTTTNNSHIKEERGVANEVEGIDEEDKYSGVHRQVLEFPPLKPSQGNKYMPPARRFPTSKPTTAGAPVDPAIISSQAVRPEESSQDRQKGVVNQAQPEDIVTELPKEETKEAKETITNNSRLPGPSKAVIPSVSATANVETEVLDSFRQFASTEKMRVSIHRRQRVSQDKAIKLNDLMKFSKNFKLLTPVPKDLVPILAKDKSKQDEIMEKAQRNAQSSTTPPKLATSSLDQKPLRPLAEAKYEGTKAPPSMPEQQEYVSTRQANPPQGPQATTASRDRQQPLPSPKSGQGLLGHRLADNRRMLQQGITVHVPQPLPILSGSKIATKPSTNPAPISSSQASSSARTPTSAVSAKFKPNPAANSFKPIGVPSNTPSPRSAQNARPASRAPSPSEFFGNKKPLPASERSSILDNFNPLKRLKEKAKNEEKTKDYAANGGIPYAYATPPTWNPFKEGDKTYKEMFVDPSPALNRASPQQTSPINPPLPHQHQLPLHLQHGSQAVSHLQPPQQTHYAGQPQNHHYANSQSFHEDPRMHLPPSTTVYQSPRMQTSNMAYPSPMAQPAQLAYPQPMPYAMGFQPTQFRQFPGPQMIPNQGPQLAAPMMLQQSSQGGFVNPSHSMGIPFNPQIPMYPPGQPPAYGGQSQPPSGYPSPGRAAPMMMHQGSHQGSHQGQQPQMYTNSGQYGPPVYAQQPPQHMMPMRGYSTPQPHFNQSPQQHYHYPSQANRAPSNNYGQPQHQHLAAQHPPQPALPMEGGEDIK